MQERATQHLTEYNHETGNNLERVPQDTNNSLSLSLIHQKQNDGEPLLWSFYVAHENQLGHFCKVTGDAELMSYLPLIDGVDVEIWVLSDAVSACGADWAAGYDG